MNQEEAKALPKVTKSSGAHPLLQMLPAHLKDHNNYHKIQKLILDAGASKHSHSDILAWSECSECQARDQSRVSAIRKLGFKNAAQYMAWKKVMDTIMGIVTKRDPLQKYNT